MNESSSRSGPAASQRSTQPAGPASSKYDFEGRFFAGRGDADYLRLLETARQMFEPDPARQHLAMLYFPAWNGLVEGPTWSAWWVQNSYGPTYCALPFWQEPWVTFVENSHALWYDQMGDGHHVGAAPWLSVAPDGSLCDCARPDFVIYKQGDGRVDLHDWGMEFTAAGVVMQCEALLIARDLEAIRRYLPKLERCAEFLESRRDPANNLYLAGAAGNLLAPSYAGWKKPDGTYGHAYLAGLSVTVIAALDRLIELERLAGRADRVELYTRRRDLTRRGLPLLMEREGYFIKYLDPDGTRHGVFGATRHGYFEAVVNHDAICFRVTDDAQSRAIYAKIAAIPELRPYDLIITNHPSLDDLYTEPTDLWKFGHWVNGGHWSTCEARMIMAYYRLGRTDDARRSMRRIDALAEQFRLDNNLTNFGRDLYQPKEPINTVYDSWGIPAAFIRGLFEYLYRADEMVVVPHIPAGVTRLEQRFPIRFGAKRLFLATTGAGAITGVRVNGRPWTRFDATDLHLPYDELPDEARIEISLGGAPFEEAGVPVAVRSVATPTAVAVPSALAPLAGPVKKLGGLRDQLVRAGLGDSYEATHARLAVECFDTACARFAALAAGTIPRLPEASQVAADALYVQTVKRVCEGLETVLASYATTTDPRKQRIAALWAAVSA